MEIIKRPNLSKNPTPPIEDGDDDDFVPDSLLFEILLRLPLKSVFTSRIVSKWWLSTSSDPSFIRAYASRASSSSGPHWIALSPSIFRDETVRPLLGHNPSKNLTLRELHLPQHGPGDVEEYCSVVATSDDGLVLYCSTTHINVISLSDFYVCNPVTGQRIRPLLCVESQLRPSWGFLTRVDARDFTLKSYRIVHAQQLRDKPNSVLFNVYYSEIGARKRFTVPFRIEGEARRLSLQESAAAVDGTLYWADTSGGGVIAYEPEAKPEQVRVIRDPDGGEKPYSSFYPYLCIACQGELRYFGGYRVNRGGHLRFGIWRLLEGGEWSLVHKIDDSVDGVSGMIIPKMDWRIVCFDPLDSDKVYLTSGHEKWALSYDMKNRALDDGREMVVDDGTCVCRFPETVVLFVPPWPIRVSEEHLERSRLRG